MLTFEGENYLTYEETGEAIGTSPSNIPTLIHRGKLVARKFDGDKKKYVKATDVENYIRGESSEAKVEDTNFTSPVTSQAVLFTGEDRLVVEQLTSPFEKLVAKNIEISQDNVKIAEALRDVLIAIINAKMSNIVQLVNRLDKEVTNDTGQIDKQKMHTVASKALNDLNLATEGKPVPDYITKSLHNGLEAMFSSMPISSTLPVEKVVH